MSPKLTSLEGEGVQKVAAKIVNPKDAHSKSSSLIIWLIKAVREKIENRKNEVIL